MMRNYNRVGRAVSNFYDRLEYEHTVNLSEETRLSWNDAYGWCVEQFGEPGERWDFYYEHEVKNRVGGLTQIGWVDTFGFRDGGDATLFVLRWV
jgi:5-methylcytosine-specific restriction endonuclease McrA